MQDNILRMLSKIMPPRKDEYVAFDVIQRLEPRFKKIYRWHAILGFLLIFAPGVLLFFLSPYFEKWWYPHEASALWALYPDPGTVGATSGVILGLALAMPLSMAIVRLISDPQIIHLYEYWYDRRPQHTINSRLFSRWLIIIFVPLALVCALFFRTQYTIVTNDTLIRSSHWGFSREKIPLSDIRAIETQYGKIAPNGNYLNGLRYRLHFKNTSPWESHFYKGSLASGHAQCRGMIEFLLNKTGLEMVDIETPRNE